MNSNNSEIPANNDKKQDNNGALLNLIFNILLPVILLNQLTKRFGENGPLIALVVALSFPIGYGLFDLVKNKKKNFISVLGIVNILFTGGLALLRLEGIWFAVKEAAFPLVIGLAVLVSAYSKKPLIRLLIFNDKIMNLKLVESKLQQKGKIQEFFTHLKKATILLSGSFFFSAILNFVLARIIFTDIPIHLGDVERSAILNEQIARMTWLGFLAIGLPCMLWMVGILWYLVKGIKDYTGLDLNEMLVHH